MLGLKAATLVSLPLAASVPALLLAHTASRAAAVMLIRVLPYAGDVEHAKARPMAQPIGTAEIVHAAARGERISAIFVNNGIYGMTGGQMAPTTLLGQKTTSSPAGRDASLMGSPIPITDMLAILPGVAYAARGSIADPGWIGKTKAMLRRSFEIQETGAGFSIVEILSTCPVGWGMTPTESMTHVRDEVAAVYPPGVLVDRPKRAAEEAAAAADRVRRPAELAAADRSEG